MTRPQAFQELKRLVAKAFPNGTWRCPVCKNSGPDSIAPEHYDVMDFRSGTTRTVDGSCFTARSINLRAGANLLRAAGPEAPEDQEAPAASDPVTTPRIEAFRWISGVVFTGACGECGGSYAMGYEHFDVWRDMMGKYHAKCQTRRAFLIQYAGQGAAALQREAGPMTKYDTVNAVVKASTSGKYIPNYPHTCVCGRAGAELFQFFECSARCANPRRKPDGL